MDLMKTVFGMLGGGKEQGVQGAVIGAVAEMLTKQGGGLGDLVQKFEAAGMGDIIKGWISTGPNPAISPDQVHAALGSEAVQGLASKAGVNVDDLLKSLSAGLPQMIDQLTPDGKMPDGDAIAKTLGGVLSKLNKPG
ncbi:MAG: YidB family protein [Caulobacterales bacterium]|jgi:uncharacterized protein YidB (DUF937 family)